MTLSLAEVSTIAAQPTSDALATLKDEWAKGGQDPFFLVMAMIAASNAVEAAEEKVNESIEDPKEAKKAIADSKEIKALKAIKAWVYSLDSSLFIWSFTHEPTWRTGDRRDTNRSLRMLGGPGEVAKGTFKSA